ncbi:conserved uncharacterized protein [Desulfococcus multivorans]|nr:conserved uncharacterized protein [Desulfococcus multivorans]
MYIAAIVFGVMMAPAWPVLGAGGGHGGGGGHGDGGSGRDMGQGGHMMDGSSQGMAQEGPGGIKIHTATVEGYHLSYELIDMKARMKGMENMPEMEHSHHLMVYVKDKDGNAVENARVGYLIRGPGNSEQRVMCMGMGAGYGADVNLAEKGAYTVNTKAVVGDKTLLDSFEYELR